MYILGALDKETKVYTQPFNAIKGHEYICIDCKKKVIFRKGEKRIPHFAHYSQTNTCTYFEHPNESQLHKDAKYKLAGWIKNGIELDIGNECPKCGILPAMDDIRIKYDNDDEPIVEYRDPNNKFIADVAIINKNKLKYIFEIKYTHQTITNVRPEPWFEFDALSILETENQQKEFNQDDGSKYYCISCIRTAKSRYCNNCKAEEEPWVENIPRLTLKTKEIPGRWDHADFPCIVCKTEHYSAVFKKGYRQICKICLGTEYESLKKKFSEDEYMIIDD